MPVADPLPDPDVEESPCVPVEPEEEDPVLDESSLSESVPAPVPLSEEPEPFAVVPLSVEPEVPVELPDELVELDDDPPVCDPVPDVWLALLDALDDGVELADEDGEALALEDGSSSGRLCDLSSLPVGAPVSLGVGVGVTLVVPTMSRTTLSVPWPRVTNMMMPAVMPTATSALTTETMMATRLFLRARSWDAASGWPVTPGRPGPSPETMTRPWRPFAATPAAVVPGLTEPITRVASPSAPITVVASEATASMARVVSPVWIVPPADKTAVSSPPGWRPLAARRPRVCGLPFAAPAFPEASSPSACAASPSDPSLLAPVTSWSFSEDALRMFWYSWEETAETIEPAATPITEPAIPILADSRNDVTAASAPATIWGMEIPLKKFFTRPTVMDESGACRGRAEKSRHDYIPAACRIRLVYRLRFCGAWWHAARGGNGVSACRAIIGGVHVRLCGHNGRVTLYDTNTEMQSTAMLDLPARLPAAVFWDMDGTLIDSEIYWAAAEQYVIERHDGTFSDEVPLRARGQSTPRLLEIVQEYIPRHVDTETLRSEIIGYVIDREREKPCWATGAVELLDVLSQAGIPNVIVSASPRAMVDNMARQAPSGAFVGYVCGEDGLAAKPDPAPYLRAAEIVGADPADCLVFEDSPVGLASGGASGATVVAITGFTPEGVVFDGPQVTSIKDYVGLGLDDLANFMELGSLER